MESRRTKYCRSGSPVKLLMENWREYLDEMVDPGCQNAKTRTARGIWRGEGDDPEWKKTERPTIAFKAPHMDQGGPRLMVVVPTTQGNVAFYQSSGTGTGRESEGTWLPFGGVAIRSNGDPWFIKLPSSHSDALQDKFPQCGTELFKIGHELAAHYAESPFQEIRWGDWLKSEGYPSREDILKATGDDLEFTNQIYGPTAINLFLNKNGKAIKKEWAGGKPLFGSQDQQWSLANIKQAYATGKLPQFKRKVR